MFVRFYNNIFNKNVIIIAKIYVRTTWYSLQQIYFLWCRKNSQYYMLVHPYFNWISIDHYKREKIPTFIVADDLYVNRSLKLSISGNNSQHSRLDLLKEYRVLMYTWMIHPTWNVKIMIYILNTILFNKYIIRIYNIYYSTTITNIKTWFV